MTEFDIYMQLGSGLEKEKKFLMAYAAYTEAALNGGTGEKELIENYLLTVGKNLSKTAQERNQELKEQLLEWIQTGELVFAISCFHNICEKLKGMQWMDTDNAILYQCLSIYQSEVSYGVKPWDMLGKGMEELKSWYYQLKFMVRRIDMNLCETADFIEYVKREKISEVALYYMIDTMCHFPQRVYNYLYQVSKEYGMTAYETFFKELWDGNESQISEMPIKKESIKEKVAFIIAVNDEEMYEEAVYYIHRLKVPEGMKIEIIPVRGSASITSAYSQGMGMTEAKYKIYMHQDVMLVNPYMLYEMCHIFENQEIGMIGVAGTTKLPDNGVWWEAEKSTIFCKIYQNMIMEHNLSYGNSIQEEYKVVEAIDGVLMITQYDIPWREDLFQGWHFYDISQSMEFGRKSYKIAIPRQDNVWCVHEQKWNKQLEGDYFEAREKFCKEYKAE